MSSDVPVCRSDSTAGPAWVWARKAPQETGRSQFPATAASRARPAPAESLRTQPLH